MVDRHQQPRAIDAPEPCFTRLRTTPHGPWLPARIYQRLGQLAGEIEGVPADVERVWTSGEIITEAEWRDLMRDRMRPKPF